MLSGQKLRHLRVNLKLSQEDVAQELNITRQSISQWENGKCFPDLDKILMLSKIYEIDIKIFFY